MTDLRKTLLILGASTYQVDVINTAKKLGLRVITLDNRPDNPGHRLSDRFYSISTTDLSRVHDVAISENIAGILAPCTDVALPTASAIGQQLGVPAPLTETTAITCDKLNFRQFQKQNSLLHPSFLAASDLSPRPPFPGPWFVKPLRASGSKGVIWFDQWKDAASLISQAKRFCLQQSALVEKAILGTQMTYEGILQKGKITWGMLTYRRTGSLPHPATIGHAFYHHSDKIKSLILPQVEDLWKRLKYTDGPFDVDLVLDRDNVVFLECAPRLGGNNLTQLAYYLCGISLSKCAIFHAMGIPLPPLPLPSRSAFVRILNAPSSGYIHYNPDQLEKATALREVEEIVLDAQPGAKVEAFVNGRCRLGHLIARADTQEEENFLVAKILNRIDWKVVP